MRLVAKLHGTFANRVHKINKSTTGTNEHSMKILLLAPHPFFQERGTPIAVDLLLRVFSGQGHEVDLLTYHEGADKTYPNVRIFRIQPPFKIKNVRPGPSFKKIICDFFLFFKLIQLISKKQYDIIHAVEETSFMAWVLKPFYKASFIYDMDSLLSTQIVDKYSYLKIFKGLLRWIESWPIRTADGVIAVCETLGQEARELGGKKVALLHDISLLNYYAPDQNVRALRKELNIEGKIVMYIGNLEKYQGIDLLLESFYRVLEKTSDAHLVIIGGADEHIRHYREVIKSKQYENHIHFAGRCALPQLPAYLDQTDIVVSPRTLGHNTPMKIYSYLDSGKPLLATKLPTHTQVLNDQIAFLADPVPESFATALLELLKDDDLARLLAKKARDRVQEKFSFEAYKNNLVSAYSDFKGEELKTV